MAWNRPTLKELYERIARDFSGRLQDGAALIPSSPESVLAKIWAAACNIMHGFLAWIFKQFFVRTSEEYYLRLRASEWGFFMKEAGFASGTAVFTANAGTTIPEGALIREPSTGLEFSVLSDAQASAGSITVSIQAVTAGASSNLASGTAVVLVTPIAGVNSQGDINPSALSGGSDAETVEEFRQRFLARLRRPPRGGAKHDYEAWALEIAGVTRAWCYPLGLGLGTVSLTFVTDNDPDGPIPSAIMVQRVQEHIVALMPADVALFEAFAPEPISVDIVLKISPDTEAIKEAVRISLVDFFETSAAPGLTISTSMLISAIGTAAGISDFFLLSPTENIEVPDGYFPILNSITFQAWG